MSETAGATVPAPAPSSHGLAQLLSDCLVLTRRGLLRYVRIPALIIFSTIQPVMLLLLFRYVFGGAIPVPGVNYVDYLVPGILVQTVVFGTIGTAVGLADDLSKGVVERFRALPMARSAVLVGRVAADTVRNLVVVLLLSVVATLVGFRFHGGPVAAVAAVVLAVLFGLVFCWINALVGLTIRDVESTQSASFVWSFPLIFASSAFVRIETMPGWLQAFAKVNPITITVDTVRDLTLGQPVATDLARMLAWMAAILAVFVPLAVRSYRRAA